MRELGGLPEALSRHADPSPTAAPGAAPDSDAVIEGDGPRLWGRDRALRRITELRDRAVSGVGSVVLVAGEAGMGKTALCDAVLLAAKHDDWSVAWTAASQASVLPGLWPWRQVLAALDGGELPQPAAEPGDPAAARVAQFDAVVRRVRDATRSAPVLAVLDDAHWADPATVAMVVHFAAVARQTRACLLVAYRPEDASSSTTLGAVLPELRRFGTEVVLEPLVRDHVAALAAETDDHGVLTRADLDALIALTRGNPLFVTEVVRLLDGRSPRAFDGLPASPVIAATIGERVARLSVGCRELLGTASVIGTAFDVATLARASDCEVATVLDRLDEAVGAAILQERGGGFGFRHPLFRSAVYDGLGTARRATAHARIAAVLERARDHGHTVELAVLAHHFGRSAPLGNAAPAARYAIAAGDEAMVSLAYETASQRYAQALAALDLDPSAGDRVAVLLSRADADAAAGRDTAAMAGYDAAAEHAARAGRPAELAYAALGRSGGAGMEVAPDEGAREALEKALAAIGRGEPAVRARLLARLSVVLAASAVPEHRVRLVAEARALADEVGDPLALADAAVARCHLDAGPESIDQRFDDAETVVRHATTTRQTRLELLGRRLRIEALFERGRVSELRRAVNEYERRAALVRDPGYAHFVPLWRAALAMADGDEATYRRERAALERVVATLPADSDGRLLARVQELFHLLDVDGDAATAAHRYRETIGAGRAGLPPQLAITEALILAVEGRDEEARRHLAGWETEIRAMPRDAEWIPAVVQLADIAMHTGDHALARWAHDALQVYPDVWAVEGIGAALRGPVSRAVAVLAEILGCTAASPTATGRARLAFDAGTWLVEFAGVARRVKDSKGMRDIAVLVARPGVAVAALDLVAAGMPTVVAPALGPVLDDTARTAYRRRIAELDEALDAADAAGEAARSASLAAERDLLVTELARAVGLGGRDRPVGSSAERARTTVTTRLKDALRRLDDAHPGAARHLRRAVRTGTSCTYDPDPPAQWEVTLPPS